MKTSIRLFKSVTSLLLLFTLCHNTYADEFTWFGNKAEGNWLIGLKGSSVQSGRIGHDDSSNSSVLLGYKFSGLDKFGGTSSLEFEMSNAFDEGDILNGGQFSGPGEWKSNTVGVYITYRGKGSVYALGKIGALKTDVSTTIGNVEQEEQDTSLSYGGGLGLNLGESGNFNVELEFVGSSGDNDINMITLGGIYRFE